MSTQPALTWAAVFNGDLLPYHDKAQAAEAAKSTGYQWFAHAGRLYLILGDGHWDDSGLSTSHMFDGDAAIAELQRLCQNRQKKIQEMSLGHIRLQGRVRLLEQKLSSQ